ncbi:MAG: ATP--guanido phosphotransferase [Clostridiales bacterium]|jgi:protein arginine kinase|nr:ATP--guanido phosphotransferase [Clostridiales bacterium]
MDNRTDNTVISTRVRLARNVSGYLFPIKLDAKRAEELTGRVYGALTASAMYDIYKMSRLKPVESEALMERHLISKDLIAGKDRGSVILNADHTVSIMVNEEDHIRAQCILPGLCPERAYKTVSAVDDCIGAALPYSFNDKLGYLTSCPTNLGTGMRASVMMFLPGLTITKSLGNSISAVGRLNMTVRGVYGEGSAADGYIYQISNQISLGYSESEILKMVDTAAGHILETELKARDILYENRREELTDEILRAYGIAAHAHLLSCDETFKLIALIKLGAYYGIIKVSDPAALDRAVAETQPAGLILSGETPYASNTERFAARARIIKNTLKRVSAV